jgi:hypothetical protein
MGATVINLFDLRLVAGESGRRKARRHEQSRESGSEDQRTHRFLLEGKNPPRRQPG